MWNQQLYVIINQHVHTTVFFVASAFIKLLDRHFPRNSTVQALLVMHIINIKK